MATIHVMNIYKWIDESRLRSIFDVFGRITSVNLFGPVQGKTTKNAIITYEEKSDAFEAVKRMNGASTIIGNLGVLCFELTNGGTCSSNLQTPPLPSHIKPPNEQTLVFVKNFKDLVDEEELKLMFQNMRVKSVSVKRENGRSLGYGFVDFEDHKSALLAVDKMNGYTYEGRKLEVAFAQRKEERMKLHPQGASNPSKKPDSVLYITNLPKTTTKEQLIELFKEFGNILSVSIKEVQPQKATTVGFVSFEKREDAVNAISKMDGHIVDSLPLAVVFKKDKY